ncbi:MAG TPA: DUF2007 domain-containing protein [Thermoanaerobaculia bacterium]
MSIPEYEIRKLVTVRAFASPWEAEVARALLEVEGVGSVVVDGTIGWMVHSNVVGGIKLQVREEDVARATELLSHLKPVPEIYLVTDEEAARLRCPACKSDDVAAEPWSRRLSLSGAGRRYVCGGCGAAWAREELLGGPEPAEPAVDDDLVTVARFHTPWEAHLARTRLEAEGIEGCVHEERLPLVSLLSSAPLPGNRLAVHPEDAERALAVLAELVESDDDEADGSARD